MEISAVTSASNNLAVSGLASPDAIDHSFSPRPGPNLADGVQTISMSFDDVLDMINPLQHIPVLSAVYRAITGDKINPVSRIAGDTLYAGPLGLASAGLAAVGAIADESFAANNNGQGSASTVVAALFGNDSAPAATQLSAASSPNKQIPVAAASPASDQTIAQAKAQAQTALASLPLPGDVPILSPSNSPSPVGKLASGQGIALDRSKAAYGGVMDPAMMASAEQNQQLALAMATRENNFKSRAQIANSRFAVAPPAAANNAPTAAPATSNAPVVAAQPATPDVPIEPATQAAMQNLIQELQAMKNVNQYKNSAQMTPIPRGNLDIVN